MMRTFQLKTKARCDLLSARAKVGRLGCVDDGEPYVVPINYVLDEGFNLQSFPCPVRKIDAMTRASSRLLAGRQH